MAKPKFIVRGVDAYASGVIWTDKEYDERIGPAIEPSQPPRQRRSPKENSPASKRDKVILAELLAGNIPPDTIRWDSFIRVLMDRCRVTEGAWGFGDRQIKRLVEALRAELQI